MWGQTSKLIAGAAMSFMAAPSLASTAIGLGDGTTSSASDSLPYLQCVPYARQVSGIRIYGDAWTWWGQAEGHYKRGNEPRIGAVMAFERHGNMKLGHVAAISRIVDSRTVLLRHSNWSPINGRRGQIEDDVRAVDVSEHNDWSKVRVWYGPIQSLGGTAWPVSGFIYSDGSSGRVLASAPATKTNSKRRDVIGEIIAGSKRS